MAASSAAGLLTACKENRNTPVQLLGILNVSAKSKGHKATGGGGGEEIVTGAHLHSDRAVLGGRRVTVNCFIVN